jgi:hypothetical protein
MTPEEAYCLFNALKLHFNSDSYDFQKFRGKIKAVLKPTDRFYWHYKKLSEFGKEEALCLILSNIIIKSKLFIVDLFSKEAKEELEFWKLRIENKYHILYKELQIISGKYPAVKKNKNYILDYYYSKEMTLESLVLLHSVLQFDECEDITKVAVLFKIKKYAPFISTDSEKINRILEKTTNLIKT